MASITYNATWTKLKTGAWGLRTENTVSPGDVLTVYRNSSNTVSRETVGEIVWAGNGVTLCTIAPKTKKARSPKKEPKVETREDDNHDGGQFARESYAEIERAADCDELPY